jgi:hypothetical protein
MYLKLMCLAPKIDLTAAPLRVRPLAGVLLALVFVVLGAPWVMTSQVVSAQSQLFVAVADADGAPITDLTIADLIVSMDDEYSETLNVELIEWPVRVTVFVDNGVASLRHLSDMREGLRLFLDEIPPDVEVAIATIGGRPQFWAEHTTDREELLDAIGVISPQPIDAAKFIDALAEEAERLDDDEEGLYFPVMVMVSTNGPEQSGEARQKPFRRMMDRMFAAKATINTLLIQDPEARGNGGLQERWGMDLANASGGVYQSLISANGFRTLLPQLAGDIGLKHQRVSNQYRVTYAPPEGVSEQPSVRVLTTRPDTTMWATIDGNVALESELGQQ